MSEKFQSQWDQVMGAIQRGASAPFKILGGMFGGFVGEGTKAVAQDLTPLMMPLYLLGGGALLIMLLK